MNIELCRAEQVADEFGISIDTLNHLATSGQVPSRKIRGHSHFRKSDLWDFLHQHDGSHPHGGCEHSSGVLPDLLRHAANRTIAGGVVCGEAHASYADLDRASSLLADSLLSRGVVPGDRVLVLLSAGLENMAACFGVWKAGGVVVAADPALGESELIHILRDCNPEAVIAERDAAERLEARRHTLIHLRAVYVKGHTFGLPHLDGIRVESLETALENETTPVSLRFNGAGADDAATIHYVKDADGRSRGVMNSHHNWEAAAAFSRKFHHLTAKDTLVLAMPMHSGSALRTIASCLMGGAKIILTPDFNQPARLVKKHKPTAMALGANELKALPEKFAPALRHIAEHLRFVEVESTPGQKGTTDALRRLLPRTHLSHWWNLTEANGAYLKTHEGQISAIERLPATLKLHVVDDQGRTTAHGKTGWISLSGAGVVSGFWGQTEFAMKSLKRDGYRLSEKASVNQRGAVTLLGRIEETWQIRGRKVTPAEIETVLRRHIRIVECAVVGVTGASGEVKVHAFAVLTAKGAMLTEAELKEYCRTFLESAKIPAHIHIEKTLPKTSDGQIARDVLRQTATTHTGKKSHWEPATGWKIVVREKHRPGI